MDCPFSREQGFPGRPHDLHLGTPRRPTCDSPLSNVSPNIWASSAQVVVSDINAEVFHSIQTFRNPPSCTPLLHRRYRLLRYYGCSDSCLGTAHADRLPGRSPRFTSRNLPTIPSPTTGRVSRIAFSRSIGARDRPRPMPRRLGFAICQEARRQRAAESSLFPTDWSFTFHCSPPRLAATQLCSVSGLVSWARGGLAPP